MSSSSLKTRDSAETSGEHISHSARVLLSLLEAEILVGKEEDDTMTTFLKGVETQKNVKLALSEIKEGCSDRILLIQSEDAKTVSETLKKILESFTGDDEVMLKLLQQEHKFHFLKILLPSPTELDFENVTNKNQVTTTRLLFSNSAISAIIGKNGAVIKKLMHENDLRILASKHYLPDSEDRVLELQGLPSAIGNAWLQISQLNMEPRSENPFSERKYSPHLAKALRGSADRAAEFRSTVMIPEEFVGALVGRGGNRIANLRKYTKTKILIESQDSAKETSSQKRTFVIVGNLERNVQIAEKMLFSNLETERGRRKADSYGKPPENSS
ncbi:KH domain-containing protein SKDI_02G1920 [Saccharomyces kudriavzevii IFO 1802]|uniref:Uncharacterized protein n=2 Tax=Saccharomyces kudriavzevii (strain ATCC MYA-4449 / AS 2.2408 / CBS 8840 / NBRC 1802 / NCYC 2889) TaxID=226230 RepID=J4U2E5_SACK1|nr:uncharacterized protein SKDI_02G1920 [Saccharomyces kudriavzevii IFO 1802]EJT44175.1 hypothetical protein SKUD_201111 [Saccharomyces kudriavzevii IFO 1802]CAI4055451.1 hypothetical protein SKDI_02G1920 [Saccharomyces kudriavzevii IFO 1802]